ncbi:myosin heavy chain MYA2-related [Trypanosoma theileri]|uniref:Myosin heavy chain MYA2-related n=1 Tax=Trypanosoma theileri TaxID=67003 RepID=A0A1X0NVL2_9TRYP|nr:myosin heavy chain MYA2-related [Trypanosoma theileri]ORC88651.1 myosin heavy chain MYA2-related [Trypanosoma theileri]
MTVDVGSHCFFDHPRESWVVARVQGKSANGYTVKTDDAERKCVGEEFTDVRDTQLAPCREDLLDEQPDDLLTLTVLHDGPLLRCLYMRYFRDIIYTNIGAIVVAINPFNFHIPWYQDNKMGEYLQEGPVIEKNIPHSWAQAHNTYHEMISDGANQCILVSGESGAGKTEATKIVMKYLAQVSCKQGTEEEKKKGLLVGSKLNACSPILECFGNARTVRNDNSSRFGKFMKVKFNEKGQLVGAETTKYLLEKSRIVTAAEDERVYHSFYLLPRGSMGAKLQLENETMYKSLNAGKCLQNSEYNTAEDFNEVMNAMVEIGMQENEIQSVWSCVGGILSLLNVSFEADGEGARVEKATEKYIKKAVALWGIDETILLKELVTTTLVVQKTETVKLLRPTLAVDARDALVKALYDGLFGWLVNKSNELCDATATGNWIGLLDIFGFEDFKKNSFEQLCINLTNESLQNHYNIYIFDKDMQECRAEGIDVTEVKCPDNLPCVRLIVDKGGILALLDEECTLGKGNELEFLEKVNQAHGGKNKFFEKKKVSRDTFIIHHYAASVTYDVNGWLDKNRDTLKDNMKTMMRSSQDPLIRELLEAPSPPEARSKRVTVGSFFKEQLSILMEVINSTNPHWIRCIKPHPAKKPRMFDGVQTMKQLASSGVLGTVQIRKAGYPVRNIFDKFNKRYKIIAGDKATGKSGRELAQIILTVCDMNKKNLSQIGKTKVFLKAEAFPMIERYRKEALFKFCCSLQRVGRGYLNRLQTNHESCEAKRKRLVELLTQEYRAYVRRSADIREAKARWRKEQEILFRKGSMQLYEVCAREKDQMYTDGTQTLLTFSKALEQSIKALKSSQADREKERQNLMDADMIERERMLKEASMYIEELRRVFYQERLLFVTMLLEDLEDLELEQRCQIRACEQEERNNLWRAYSSRCISQQLVMLVKQSIYDYHLMEAMEVLQREEIRERRALEQRHRSYQKSFLRQSRDMKLIARQLTHKRNQFEEARMKQVMLLQEVREAERRELRSQSLPSPISLILPNTNREDSAASHSVYDINRTALSLSSQIMSIQQQQQEEEKEKEEEKKYRLNTFPVVSTNEIASRQPYMKPFLIDKFGKYDVIPLSESPLKIPYQYSSSSSTFNYSPLHNGERQRTRESSLPSHSSPYWEFSPRQSAPLTQSATVYEAISPATGKNFSAGVRATSYSGVQESVPSAPRYKRSKRWM